MPRPESPSHPSRASSPRIRPRSAPVPVRSTVDLGQASRLCVPGGGPSPAMTISTTPDRCADGSVDARPASSNGHPGEGRRLAGHLRGEGLGRVVAMPDGPADRVGRAGTDGVVGGVPYDLQPGPVEQVRRRPRRATGLGARPPSPGPPRPPPSSDVQPVGQDEQMLALACCLRQLLAPLPSPSVGAASRNSGKSPLLEAGTSPWRVHWRPGRGTGPGTDGPPVHQ